MRSIHTFYRGDLRVGLQTRSDQIDGRDGDRTGRYLHAVAPHPGVAVGHMVSEQWPPRWRADDGTEDWHSGVSRTPKRRRRRCAYTNTGQRVVVGRAGPLRVLRDRVKPLALDMVPVTTDVGAKVIGGGARHHVAIVSRGTPIRLSDYCCRRRRVLCVLKSKCSNFIIYLGTYHTIRVCVSWRMRIL